MKRPWFKARQYGYGWYPGTWQGWAVLVLYLLLLVFHFVRIDSYSHSVSDTLIGFLPKFVMLTILLMGVCLLTGEEPHWQWGNKVKSKQVQAKNNPVQRKKSKKKTHKQRKK